MRKLLKLLTIFFILSLFTMAFCRGGQPENAIQGNESEVTLTIKAASISIDGNAELAANVTAGDGSASNPYVIENYVINASGLVGQGILINNTNAHFILRNCTVTDGNASWGIWLENVTNGHLDNNTIRANGGGINLWESEFNTISNNSIIGNGGYGILLFPNCYNNTLVNNTVNHGSGSGISLRNSWNNTLIGNTANDNDDNGFRFRNADENTLTANTANENHFGFYLLEYSDWNTLTGNTANDNDNGIILSQSKNNTMTGNTANNNTQRGIWIKINSHGNTLTNNTVTSNGDYGVEVNISNGNYFYRNIIWQNKDGLPGNQILDLGGNNWVENLVNTSGDFDGDGLVNNWEVDNSLNPWNADMDGDGLTDGAEILTYLTNATNPDTDGDLMLDGWEVQNSLNPVNQLDALLDYDGDGLKNAVEFIQNTDPNNWDSDGDGYSDGIELAAGTNPLDEFDFPSTPAPEPESILLELSILIGCIVIAAAIVIYGLLQRSRPVAAPPPKSAPPAPKKPGKGI